jgi:hypothetical protein
MNIDDKLSQVFDIEPIIKSEVITQPDIVVSKNDKLESDYETTRTNLHALLIQGQDALNHALEVAKASEHPRAFEVVGGLMKHVADINTQLLDLHKKKQSIEAPDKKTQSTTNNSIFVGSTTDLSKMLNDLRKGK